jgi:hypothetical protein
MPNYLKMPKQSQVLALLELGWSYRRIEAEIGVRRETVSRHDRSAPTESADLLDVVGSNAAQNVRRLGRKPGQNVPRVGRCMPSLDGGHYFDEFSPNFFSSSRRNLTALL